MAKYYAKGNHSKFSALLLRLVGAGALLAVGGVLVVALVGEEVLTLLYRPEYGEYADVFLWVMLGLGIRNIGSFLGYGMTAARRFKIQTPLSALITLTSLLMSFLMVPTYGLLGAAIALTLSAIVKVAGGLVVIFLALRRSGNVPNKVVS